MPKVKSGAFWVTWANAHAKNSTSLDDLVEPFKGSVKGFVSALQVAGATVRISSTRRSNQRAYLFHWCWRIGLGKALPSEASTMPGVEIEWDHGDLEASRRGAAEMIAGFGLAVPPVSTNAPSPVSNHSSGLAVDMTITWVGTIAPRNRNGTPASVLFMPNVNLNTRLHAVGATYGVKKLVTDAPHWSLTGG